MLLVCYRCNMEFIGLAWMVRWEKFTHKTYDLKVLWNNQWYWMKYCIWVMFICMIVHQGHTPCTSICMVFLCFHEVHSFHSQILVFCRWSQCLLQKNTNLEEQEHIGGPAMFNINSKATHQNQINAISLPHYFAFFKRLVVFTMLKELLN